MHMCNYGLFNVWPGQKYANNFQSFIIIYNGYMIEIYKWINKVVKHFVSKKDATEFSCDSVSECELSSAVICDVQFEYFNYAIIVLSQSCVKCELILK